jgi:HD-like signal output (HDOD) protein
LAQKTDELQVILQTLDSLQSRVKELTQEDPSGPVQDQVTPPSVRPDEPVLDPVNPETPNTDFVDALPESQGDIPDDHMSLLRGGVAELNRLTRLKDFPEFFDRLAQKTGLRLVLLKRWTSGLQVFMERNIKMPSEAKRKRRDGRAPIPCKKGDLFSSVGEEGTVYCGPVPVKHFPLDLTLMLGRGSKDRHIIILPLPTQNHWNTFLYLDADQSGEKSLAVAEVLAHFALARMCLLNKGVRVPSGRVAAILRSEIARRRGAPPSKATVPSGSGDDSPGVPGLGFDPLGEDLDFVNPPRGNNSAGNVSEQARQLPPEEVDPFVVQSVTQATPTPVKETIPLAPAKSLRKEAGTTADLPESDPEIERGRLTPEGVLHHSGELPALPKAACHIMAVIEDPKTTATRLEKALAMDQTLTAKVLRIANSPFYGAVREIRTVSEAIVRLGFVTIRNWTVVTATKSVFLAPGAGSLYKKIWRQSVMSAMAGQLVAQNLRMGEPENIFIGGLMQNIGQLVLARSHPELFQQILTESEHSGRPYHDVEKQLLGFDHGELGALLIKEWNLSQDLEEAVRWHHRFDDPEAGNARVAAMIALGEEVAACSGVEGETAPAAGPEIEEGAAAEEAELPPLSPVCRYLGVTHAQYEDLKREAAKLQIDPHFFS